MENYLLINHLKTFARFLDVTWKGSNTKVLKHFYSNLKKLLLIWTFSRLMRKTEIISNITKGFGKRTSWT